MFSAVAWFLLIAGTALWVGSFPSGWDFNADGHVTILDLWRMAGVVAILPVVAVCFAVAAVVPEPALRFLEFGPVADWLIKGSLSGLIGMASWLLILVLLFKIEFWIMQKVSPGGWKF